MRRPTLFEGAFFLALLATISPLWAGHYLPFVDIPQHLHLINVLGHLNDPSTLYPEVFKPRGEITPYLGYYYAVWLLARVFDLFTANALFLTLVAVAAPLSVGALSRALGGSFWIGLLACPLFFGDNLYWGFINYCAALPLVLYACAVFIHILEREPHPRYLREVGLAVLLIAVQLTHVQAFVFAGVALPALLLLTPSDKVRRLRAIGAVVPAVALFAIWSLGRLGDKPDVAPGQPWKAWGPILSRQNLSFYDWDANLKQLPTLLANGLRDSVDSPIVTGLLIVGLAALGLAAATHSWKGWRPRPAQLRGPVLALLALVLFLFMPFDVRGYMYYVNYRFAELFVLVAIAALPFPRALRLQQVWVAGATVLAVWYGLTLRDAFARFNVEANSMDTIIRGIGEKPRIMALSFDTTSAIATHPVYLHYASYGALARGGITSFSFAATAHSPLAYRIDPPPAPTSEWRADQFDYPAYGAYYDYYLVRGNVPARYVFRGHENEVRVAAQSGRFTLYTRRP